MLDKNINKNLIFLIKTVPQQNKVAESLPIPL